MAAASVCSKADTEAVRVSVTAALLPDLKALYMEEHKKTDTKRITQYMAMQNNKGWREPSMSWRFDSFIEVDFYGYYRDFRYITL